MKKQPIISLLCCFLLFVAGCSTPHQGNTYDIIALSLIHISEPTRPY